MKCEAEIDAKYIYCMKCNDDISIKNILQEIAKHLDHMNWNLGLIQAVLTKDEKLLKKLKEEKKETDNNGSPSS